ncbi:unnamed protein product, partial [marine sediment metagenome]
MLFMEREFGSLLNSEATKTVTPMDSNQKIHVVTPLFIIALCRALN